LDIQMDRNRPFLHRRVREKVCGGGEEFSLNFLVMLEYYMTFSSSSYFLQKVKEEERSNVL